MLGSVLILIGILVTVNGKRTHDRNSGQQTIEELGAKYNESSYARMLSSIADSNGRDGVQL